MRKTQPLLNPLNSLPVLCVQVCLPAEISCSQTPLNPLHDRKSIGADLYSPTTILPLANLSPHSAPLRCFTIPIAENLCAAPRFSPTSFYPPIAPAELFPQLDCLQPLGIKRYTLGCLRWKIKHLTVLRTTIANRAVLGLQGLQTLLLRSVISMLANRYVA